MRKMLDIVTGAVAQYRVYGRRGISEAFDQMSQEERVAFDLWLVKVGDQLAQHAGTVESRFTARVLSMALNRPAVNAMGFMDTSEPTRG